MTLSEIISIFGYNIAVVSLAVAVFTSQIEAWRERALVLVSEWSPPRQKADVLVKLEQQNRRDGIIAATPHVALWSPAILALLLIATATAARKMSSSTVSIWTFLMIAVLPTGVVVLLWVLFERGRMNNTSSKLTKLS